MEIERDKNGRFAQGNKGGPGRKLKEDTFCEIAKQILDAKEIDITVKNGDEEKVLKISSTNKLNHTLAAALLIDGINGNVAATKELLNRAHGLPKATVETKDLTEKEMTIVVRNEEDVKNLDKLGDL